MPQWLFFPAPLGTNFELSGLDYARLGQPFCWVPAKTSIILETMDYARLGQPFISYARG